MDDFKNFTMGRSKILDAEIERVSERVQSLVYFDEFEEAENEIYRFDRFAGALQYWMSDSDLTVADNVWLAVEEMKDLLPAEPGFY